MNILLYSNTLDHLDRNKASTSSKLFEIEFAHMLSNYANVSIMSYKAKQRLETNEITLFPLNESLSIKEAIKSQIQNNSIFEGENNIIIAFGYKYNTFKELNKLTKIFDAKLVSYTFDTHKGAINHLGLLKRTIVNFYFYIGMKYINNIDGIILVNEGAVKEMKLNIPYLISRIGIREELISSKKYKRNNNKTFRMIYTGTLIDYNSIEVLIESMSYLRDQNILLDIYGDGPLRKSVEIAVKKNKNIFYHGIVSNEQINNETKKADLLINLRNINSYVSKFAFPSKLIEYMASGIPVLTTKVLKDEDFNKSVFLISDLNAKEVSEQIKYIHNQPALQSEKSKDAKEYVKNNFIWEAIEKDIRSFLVDLNQSGKGQ